MKLNRRKTSLALLVLGILGISIGLITPWSRLARISYLKYKLPKRIYKINQEMTELDNDPNSDVREYWALLGEASRLDMKTNWFDNVDKINALVARHNNTRPYYRDVGSAGLFLATLGYFWKRREDSEIQNI